MNSGNQTIIKKFIILPVIALIILLAWLGAEQFPYYKWNLRLLPILFLIDFLAWKSLHERRIFPKLNFLYFILPVLVVILFLFSSLTGVYRLNQLYLNLLFGLIPVFYLPKLIFLIIITVAAVSRKIIKMKRKTFHPEKFSFILSGLVFLFLCFKLLYPVGAFEINKIKIQINKPLESELKIVQISDLHLGSWLNKNRIQKMVDEVNNLEPDLIFITGDFVNYNSKETEPFGPILKKLKSKLGVFAILGNHDYGEYIKWDNENQKNNDFQELKHFIKSAGCTLLLNENIKIVNNSDTVYIAGTENWGIKNRYPKKADLKKALKNLNFEKPVLLLSHDPEFWRHFIKDNNNKTDITFSGHTHGGQVGNKNINQKIAKFLNIYLAGLYKDSNHQYLYVNSGIGFLGLPFRIGISPEITEFVVNKM